MRALSTASTGMMAMELNVQVIANNLANMTTTGFKRQRVAIPGSVVRPRQPDRHANFGARQHPAGGHRYRLRCQNSGHAAAYDARHAGANRRQPRYRGAGRWLLQAPAAGRHLRLHPRWLVPNERARPDRRCTRQYFLFYISYYCLL